MTRFIIIEGGIGVGKSTLLSKLKKIYNSATFLGEYIEEPRGQVMFELFREGKYTTEEFQNYILNYWKRSLAYYDKGTYFLERGPLAGLAFVDNHTMKSFKEFEADVLAFMDNIDMKMFKFIEVKARLGIETYANIINNIQGNLVLFIAGTPEELLQGVKERKRDGEEGYTKEFLISNQNSLYNLYKVYKDELNVEFINSN